MFDSVIRQFSDNLANLRDFVDLVGPFLTQKNIEEVKQDSVHLAPLALAIRKLLPEVPQVDEANESKALQLLTDDIKIDVEKTADGGVTIHTEGRISSDLYRAM